jgi:ABC-type uncharacterized transport system permease subunit
MSLIFALMTLGLAVNQVATGLALTILGIGLSGLIGAGFVGEPISPGAASVYSRPHRYPAGRRICSARTPSSISRWRWSSASGSSSTARGPG